MTDSDITVELFHARWCGHCKRLKPEWDQFIKKYGGQVIKAADKCGNDVTVVKLENGQTIKMIEYEDEVEKKKETECTGYEKSKIVENDIDGFPTFIVTRNGKRQQESVPRTTQGMYDYFMGGTGSAGGAEKYKQCGGGRGAKLRSERDKYYMMKYGTTRRVRSGARAAASGWVWRA